ncbi:MAG: histidine--tRNA ligase [Oscillospiraceae bacterium]|jgi:histidyl-tRNA synthetase|nr:histidine--tRNA ligase [Oscillospiraceae bacterium]
MSFFIKRVRGTKDVLPPNDKIWSWVESVMKESAAFYGFLNVRTPVIEFTELFKLSSGETSDVVQKEMYTFDDKSGRSISLRPEFTAGVLRAILEDLNNQILPLKLMYFGPCFRYEKPQSGRYREFFQFGIEIFGGNSVNSDIELLFLANYIFKKLGLKNVKLEINAIGCKECHNDYRNLVLDFFNKNLNNLCSVCRARLEKNPLRIFDCKEESCQKICQNAPVTVMNICKECNRDFEEIKNTLTTCGIEYKVNPYIVRGLDYYTKFVFEFIVATQTGNLTVCGGGRYDGLSKFMGGPDLCATGFAIGVERIIEIIKTQKIEISETNSRDLYIACLISEAKIKVTKIISKLREFGIKADINLFEGNVKSQIQFANKAAYKYFLAFGNEEIKNNSCKIKNMSNGEIFEIVSSDDFGDNFIKTCIETVFIYNSVGPGMSS